MLFIQNSLKINNRFFLLYLFVIFLLLVSCGGRNNPFRWDPADARKVDPNVDVRARQAIEEGRGISADAMFGKGIQQNSGIFQFASSNPLWRATIEVLDFLPLSNVDYSGGLVITDWYNEGTASGESIKITVRFLSNEIRADGIKVIIHKKVCTKLQTCKISKITSALETEVKTAILKKATIYEKENRKKYKKAYQKKYGDRPKKVQERE